MELRRGIMSRFRWLTILALGLAAAPASLAAQDRGTVTGVVVEAGTMRPLSGVQISIAGTQLGTLTNQEGRYIIMNVPAGAREVRATRIGYAQGTQQVTVVAGETVTADFTVTESAVALEGLVVTATGETQRVRERGNVIGQIQVAEMELAPITTMSDLLQGRTAGMTVQRSAGTTGAGSRVRIRGSASASLGNQPLLIIDGIRVNESPNSFSIGLGGQAPSRLEDLNPDEIENIEILKGPAAAALYGTAAATGVIQVTTRRGRAGPARWTAYTEGGLIQERNEWPGNYMRLGDWGDGDIDLCPTLFEAAGWCEPTGETLYWNPLMDRAEGHGVSNPELGPASPFRDGNRQKFGLNVSGGTEQTTYFLSAENEDESGIFRNNNLNRTSLRANIRSSLRDDLGITLTTGWITSDLQLPRSDNALGGAIGDAITGEVQDDPIRRGYSYASPENMALQDTRQGLGRLVGSANVNYRPLSWLSVVGTAGLDVLNRHDSQTIPPGIFNFQDFFEGMRVSNRIDIRNYTATLGATATRQLTDRIFSTTSLGTQYNRETFRGTFASGFGLLAGTESLEGVSARPAVGETNQDIIMVGAYGQQQFALDDRLFVTAALRGDDNSAFGTDFGLIWYPSLSVSYVLSEEAWFPRTDLLNSFRLRGAYGRSGLRPGFRQALTFYTPVAATVEQSRDQPAFAVGGVGDPELSPEISTEVEGGFDLGLFNDRLGIEFTYYDKTSREALINRRLAPSLGMAPTRFENVGTVSNSGIEVLANARVLDLPNARWNARVSVATNRNRLVEMEGDPIIFGLASGQQHRVGYPLGGYWIEPILGWEENPAGGILSPFDVEIGDTVAYAGSPLPTRNISVGSDLTLWNTVRFSGLLEHQGGHTLWSGTDEWQCVFLICADLNDPNTPLDRQARAIGTYWYFTWWGYLEDASYWKLRELSMTLMAPSRWTERLRFDGLSLTLSGRNLATWTNYTGLDPEVNFAGQDNFTTADFQSAPPVRHFTARLTVNF
jgi:TonB-linked SusC/RagA family outer membrane protein